MPGGGDLPDPNDPQQMQRFMSQLQQLFATPGGGPVNWDLARQIAQAHLTGVPGGAGGQMPFGLMLPQGLAHPPVPPQPADEDRPGPVGDPAVTPADGAAVTESLHLADL